jgi:acyl-coenzyme A thioesterase PaaI-like protein
MDPASTTRMATVVAPTDAVLGALCAREHADCFACRPVSRGGLGLCFRVQADGSVAARWIGPPGGESYRGVIHGGLQATALDSAMVHALFARGLVARTAELKVRYRHSAGVGEVLEVRAWLRRSFGPLHELEAEIQSGGVVCARAWAKFMADQPAGRVSINAAICAAVLVD